MISVLLNFLLSILVLCAFGLLVFGFSRIFRKLYGEPSDDDMPFIYRYIKNAAEYEVDKNRRFWSAVGRIWKKLFSWLRQS